MKIAIIGKGQLACEFLSQLPPETTAGFSRPVVDITDPTTFGPITAYRPDLIINCAAYTAVDAAETERDLAFLINGEAPGNLAEFAKKMGALFVHVSTDYVFDGTNTQPYSENDPTNPINVYGQSKLQGEKAVQAASGRYIIARTAWLYGQQGPNFVLTMRHLLRTKPEVKVVTDQIGSPTYTQDLASQIMGLVSHSQEGLFHCVNNSRASKLELATAIRQIDGCSAVLRPAVSADFRTPARRPNYTVLSTVKLAKYVPVRNWQEALRDYLYFLS